MSKLKEGIKLDTGKLRYDLLSTISLEELVKVLTFGSIKYEDRNWEKGIKFSRVFAAALRHLFTLWRGEDFDPETGILHSAHAECNTHFLTQYLSDPERYKEFDDRPKQVKNVKKKPTKKSTKRPRNKKKLL